MVIVRLKGGMGNQMFQYAAGRALAAQHGAVLGLDPGYLLDRTPRKGFTFREYDLDVFTVDALLLEQKDIPFVHRYFFGAFGKLLDILKRILKLKGVERSFSFNTDFFSFGPNAYLDGYWQSPKYFERITATIRADFTLRKPLALAAAALRDEIAQAESVCVHIRRGDFVGNALHDTFDKNYYAEALAYIASKRPIGTVHVFSDDIEWCRENISFPYPTQYVGMEHAGAKGEGHLALMSACKHFVIANSSFSWWAAWLAINPDKIVVAPKRWFADPSIDTSDLIPETWVRL